MDDVARANLAALEAVTGERPGAFAAYNIASGTPVTIGSVAELVSTGSGHDQVPEVTGRYRLGDVRHIVASPARATRDLGFTAQVPPTVGLPAFATEPLRA